MMTALKLVPNWAYGLLLAVALLVGVYLVGHSKGDTAGAARVQASWDTYKDAAAKSEAAAIAKRTAENTALAAKQATDNAAITKAHDEENARTIAALTVRLRRGAGICSNGGPAAPSGTQSTSISDAASPATGVFRGDLDRDIKSAIKAAEDAASTARSCQAFITVNGMAP